ncbi:GNAT family N-acetyltransferase [Polynucleobacter sp. AP-Nino-20-G2]|uniref:GNAT family N-acetyltransferase n=1 Tax=Polynucleobacter sp. AP-Nino-20-G2 TaxID=2576917 RepID=UPI001BFE8650|nr:GNAT family N-acetyltransferase [Polynucleobacter sp. AP-Nino-20-G2]QWE16695.1 GNAT family N-acetyltransferase [Polynucleobacter sp. AP-Nino-20-G2]
MHNKLANGHLPGKPYMAGLVVPVRELHAGHREEILRHLLLLNEEDRRLRFGTQTPDEVIEHYVERLDFNKDAVFGSFDSQLHLVGMAHLAYLPKVEGQSQAAEFGVSVLPNGRGQGIGTALLARAAVHSRNTRIETLFVHCLANNKAMMHLAQKAGMRVEYAYGDADAYLKLPPANPATIVEEAANKQWADFDYALKENLKRSNEAWWWFLGRPTNAS